MITSSTLSFCARCAQRLDANLECGNAACSPKRPGAAAVLDDPRLVEIARCHAASSDGEWEAQLRSGSEHLDEAASVRRWVELDPLLQCADGVEVFPDTVVDEVSDEDATFIANAHQDIPYLLTRTLAAENRADVAESALDEIRRWIASQKSTFHQDDRVRFEVVWAALERRLPPRTNTPAGTQAVSLP